VPPEVVGGRDGALRRPRRSFALPLCHFCLLLLSSRTQA
jgi:hypothetical protein